MNRAVIRNGPPLAVAMIFFAMAVERPAQRVVWLATGVFLLAGGLWRRAEKSTTQCQRPTGWMGRLVIRSMNRRHSKLTDWGLGHLSVRETDTILDVGCGGGRTIAKLADLARRGTVHGIDYAPADAWPRSRNFTTAASTPSTRTDWPNGRRWPSSTSANTRRCLWMRDSLT